MTHRVCVRAFLRAPSVHFVVLGGLLFAGVRWVGGEASRAASPADAAFVAAAAGDDEILWREALALQLDRRDPLVRRRLAQLGQLVARGDVEDAAAFEHEARRLGLERTDLVVRRHLVHAMRLALAYGGPAERPGDDEIAAYFARHRDRWAQPPRLRFRHVYFARDRAGTPAARAAAAALATLRATPDDASAAGRVRGDSFLDGSDLALSAPELERRFGAEFAAALAAAPVGRWIGPVRSSYGVHVVRIDERSPSATPSLESVRGRVVHALLAERAAARLERRLAERRAPRSAVEPSAAAW